jgi:DNA-binding winged helix-turn-helix (wHTH) protein/TolB-like protein/Flp pilus assembly protein TadD
MRDSSTYKIGCWISNPAQSLLERDGVSVRVEPRTMDVLTCLARHAGQVVSVEELIESVWAGVIVSNNSVYLAVSQLRRALRYGDDSTVYIETIPKRGYRLVAPVEMPEPVTGTQSAAARPAVPDGLHRRLRIAWLAAACVVVLLAVGVIFAVNPGRSVADDRIPRSIAVLPFEDVSPNEADRFYAPGEHARLNIQLGKVQNLNVIEYDTVLSYGLSPSLEEIARDLRVESVLAGQFEYADGKVHLAVELVDPADGAMLWARDYRRDFADMLDIHANVVVEVADVLDAAVTPTEVRRIERPPTESNRAYALYLKALAPDTATIEDGYEETIRLLGEAIDVDPNFAEAFQVRGLARASRYLHATEYEATADSYGWETDPGADLERAIDDSERALALDPELGAAHSLAARLALFVGDLSRAEAHAARALGLSPNDAEQLRTLAMFELRAQRLERAHDLLVRASRIAPAKGNSKYTESFFFFLAGDVDASAEIDRTFVEDDLADAARRAGYGTKEAIRGNNEIAESELRLAENLADATTDIEWWPVTIYGYGLLGLHDDARRVFDEYADTLLSELKPLPFYEVWIYLGIGDKDKAYGTLARIAAEPLPPLTSGELAIVLNVANDPVLDEPRFLELRRRAGYLP